MTSASGARGWSRGVSRAAGDVEHRIAGIDRARAATSSPTSADALGERRVVAGVPRRPLPLVELLDVAFLSVPSL